MPGSYCSSCCHLGVYIWDSALLTDSSPQVLSVRCFYPVSKLGDIQLFTIGFLKFLKWCTEVLLLVVQSLGS